MNRTVDGVEVALVKVDKPQLTSGGLLPLHRGHYWLETAWTFRNVTDHAVRLQRPSGGTGMFTARAFAPNASNEVKLLQPHELRRVQWFFQIPQPAPGIWISYGTGDRTIWYHLKLHA